MVLCLSSAIIVMILFQDMFIPVFLEVLFGKPSRCVIFVIGGESAWSVIFQKSSFIFQFCR